jgi:hypothetical protein
MRILLFLSAFLLASAFSFPLPDVKLEYTFKVGDEYTWTQSSKQKIKQSIMGMEQSTETVYDSQLKLKVVSLTATGAKFETSFTKMKNTVKSPMGDMIMDSDGTPDAKENKIFKAMMNKTFYLTMNKRGVVENIEGVENLWSGFSGLGLTEAEAATLQQSMEQMLGKNSLKGTFEQAFVTYPDKKVKPGDTWTTQIGAPMSFPLRTDNTWSLVDINATTANLKADGVFVTTDKEKTMSLPGGIKAKVDLSGNQAIKAKANPKTGWPTDLSVMSEVKGKMIILAGGMVPEDMEVPMEISSEGTFTIVKK